MISEINTPKHLQSSVWTASLLLLGFLFSLTSDGRAQSVGGGFVSAARVITSHQDARQIQSGRKKGEAAQEEPSPVADPSLQRVQSKSGKNPSGGQEHIDAAGTGTLNKIPKWNETGGQGTLVDTVAPIFESAGGNVGIGTTSPGAGLDVVNAGAAGTITARFKNSQASSNTQVAIDAPSTQNTNLRYDDGGSPVWYLGNAASNDRFRLLNSNANGNTEVFTVLQGGNVGIGTMSPSVPLHIKRTFVNSFGQFVLQDPSATGNASTIYGSYYDSAGTRLGILGFGRYGGANDPDYYFANEQTAGGFAFRNASQTNFYITNGGKVGIGTTSPSTQLHIVGDLTLTGSGNISATGNIAAKYQDVAEWVPSSRVITAGTVVVLDAELSNHVLPSSRAYDTRVAGVVSASPGVILGEGGAGKVMVATTGRVRVKVDATVASIRVGDLLVTSDKEGIAMRSQPLDLGGTPIHRPGTLIGKALEPLEKGVGEILVLLSLQ